MNVQHEKEAQFHELVNARIETLRPRLLDLSRRNPLISTRFSTRSSSLIRVVDELPEVIAFALRHGQAMRFIPLPPLNWDPQDEQNEEFQNALSSARLTDETYLEALHQASDESIGSHEHIERDLKDRLRLALGMAPRQKKEELSLAQHAENNGIAPSYDLPYPRDEHKDGRHTDENIQTLLLPEDLERKLSALQSKCVTWEQETGINVLHVAFGFLEWFEPNNPQAFLAPLVLLPVKLEKRKTRGGIEFWVNADGDDAEANYVLAEMMRREFGITLPPFQRGRGVEDYFCETETITPPTLHWRVLRQIAIGVFPSARMAMYADLDSGAHNFTDNPVIADLLYGSNAHESAPFADEYDVDAPAIEAKVPYLVMDADSSQFSAIVDIAEGKNLAVEGPPGTGKSQTIVNAIAAALAQGKKVLFVAEKMAALEVVKSRLEAVGLGEFILPLQAKRSTREQVVASIRSRMEMPRLAPPRDYEAKINAFRKVRDELAAYLKVIASFFGNTGVTVYAILGKNIANHALLHSLPTSLVNTPIHNTEAYNFERRDTLITAANILEKTWQEASQAKPCWKGLTSPRTDRFAIVELQQYADDASKAVSNLSKAYSHLKELAIPTHLSLDALHYLHKNIGTVEEHLTELDTRFIKEAVQSSSQSSIREFFTRCTEAQRANDTIEDVFIRNTDKCIADTLRNIKNICDKNSFATLDVHTLENDLLRQKNSLEEKQAFLTSLQAFIAAFPPAQSWSLASLRQAHLLIQGTPHTVLAMRSKTTADPDASAVLKRLCQYGTDLFSQKEKFASALSVYPDIDVATLASYIVTLKNSGFFSFLSGQYRAMKRYCVSISQQKKFIKESAATDLQSLASYIKGNKEFNENMLAVTLFGKHFNGIETDFDLFTRLVEFYDNAEALFTGIQHRDIRSLIKTGELDLLLSIPSIPNHYLARNFNELEESIALEKSEFELRTQAISALKELVAIFKAPQLVATGSIESLIHLTERFALLKSTLDADLVAQSLLRQKFHGWQTQDQCSNEMLVLELIAEDTAQGPIILSLIDSCNVSSARRALETVFQARDKALSALSLLSAQSGIPFESTLAVDTLEEMARNLHLAAQDTEGLLAHAALASERNSFADIGFAWIVDSLESGQHSLTGLANITEALLFHAMARRVYDLYGPTLSRFHDMKLNELRAELAQRDKELIFLARQQLIARLQSFGEKAPVGNGVGRKSEWTELSLIKNEISKKLRFLPVRDVTRRSGQALLELKPCWMMSPLAVAQYLPHGAPEFDLCILDEASQMPPENAIGALVRCKQAMVVGDTNQLPPTNFFQKMLEDDEVDEDEAVLEESILEMANSAFRPRRTLRWHYRSRHSGLIRFSNHHVYDDRLVIFPSPTESCAGMGVSLVAVESDYKSGVNRKEASAIVEAALHFMRTTSHRSLGIVTLNQKQRDLIQEKMDRALLQDAQAALYVEEWLERNDGLESFFIKNLENVQGDERDVIFIGTVYGAEKNGGPVMQRFGPINGLAGKRRLNVLFSRAKEQIVTFSSMTANDIRAEEHSNPGAYMLKCWLEYSATGLLPEGISPVSEPGSDFEVFVINQLKAMGCEPVPQVGVAGYRIDIGVRHPSWPYGYIMGVECDGAAYHSSRSARERDRLREEVLTNLGWKLHRIWSTSWFNDPHKEGKRLRAAIEERLQALQRSDPLTHNAAPAKENEQPEETPAAMSDNAPQIQEPQAQVLPEQELPTQEKEQEPGTLEIPQNDDIVEIGDTVTVRYLNGEQNIREVTLSDIKDDPERGIIHINKPLGRALLDAELGDEIEILSGHFVRKACIERIKKGSPESKASAFTGLPTPVPASPSAHHLPPRNAFDSKKPFSTAQSKIKTTATPLSGIDISEKAMNQSIKAACKDALFSKKPNRANLLVQEMSGRSYWPYVQRALSIFSGGYTEDAVTMQKYHTPELAILQFDAKSHTYICRADTQKSYAIAIEKFQKIQDETVASVEVKTAFKHYKSKLSPDKFYDDSYLQNLQTFAAEIVDSLAPITFNHLSETIARAHNFQRTGTLIKKQVWAAISHARPSSRSPNGETVFWPKDATPVNSIPFRGMIVNAVERSWQNVPYPERLGLALEVLATPCVVDRVTLMADKIGLSRLQQSTRKELESILAEAQHYKDAQGS